MRNYRRYLFLAQGGYYLPAGCWPFVNIHSFRAVTAWQSEIWLMKTAGALVIAFSLALLWQSLEGRRNRALQKLAIFAGIFFAFTGTWHYFEAGMKSLLLIDPIIQAGFAYAGYRVLKVRRSRSGRKLAKA